MASTLHCRPCAARPGAIAIGLIAVILSGRAAAASTGSVRGGVVDRDGTPLPGVTLALENPDAGVAPRGAVTARDGAFHFPALPPGGDYVLRASCPSFATLILSEIEVRSDQATALTVVLQPESALRDRIEVHARPPIVNLDEPATTTRIGEEFMEALPILGRNYQDVLTLAPGVSDTDGDGNPNVHGARDTDVVTLVDGVSSSDPYTGKVGAQLNIESIQEIEFKTSGATAEFGRAQGGFANIITKSGGNEFEGAFKFHWRGRALDGDGAGIDDPLLHGGIGQGDQGDLEFNDLLAFLSLSGPIASDRAWYYLAIESIQREDPVNEVTAAIVAGVREFRNFLKLTWQATPASRLALSINRDPQEYLNEGLNSYTREEAGYTDEFGGTMVTAKATSVLSPTVVLETLIAGFDEQPARVPNLHPDTNGNGYLWADADGDGLLELSEHDAGEDLDGDGHFDVFEPIALPCPLCQFPIAEDRDGDFAWTGPSGCEGTGREDRDCDGTLDINEDLNGNGTRDRYEFDEDGDGRLDTANEDRNGNGKLDDTPFPTDLYPYGRLAPTPPDRNFTIDRSSGVRSGPYWEDLADTRTRFTLREDLSVHVPDFFGTHDVKGGFVLEREAFDRDTRRRPIVAPLLPPPMRLPTPPGVFCVGRSACPEPIRLFAINPIDREVHGEADATVAGVYLQDQFRPRPNLSLGIGVRFDREVADSAGYTPFDPSPARDQFDILANLSGWEKQYGDAPIGNGDGIQSLGVGNDPIFNGFPTSPPNYAPFVDPLLQAMPRLFLRHHGTARFGSEALRALVPEAFEGGEVRPEILERYGVFPQRPQNLAITNNNLAPRLSISWDPVADGRTRLFATWGRYYDKLFLSTVVGEQGPDLLNRYYMSDNKALAGAVLPATIRLITAGPPSVTQVERDLRTPFSDELTLGFEREIAPETALSLTIVRRQFRDQLQDVDINHELHYGAGEDPVDLVGRLDLDSEGVQHRVPDGRPDLYVNNPFFNQILRVGNFNDAHYQGITLALRRRLARRWEMNASYTYSRALGDAEAMQAREGNDPSIIEAESGYLAYDQRHVVKVNGLAFLPRDWQAGGTLTWGSGLPFSVISRFFALDNWDYPQLRTLYGYTTPVPGEQPRFVPVRRNSLRNAPTLEINLSARKSLVLGKTAAALFFEVFNLLNTDDLRIHTYEPVSDAEVEALASGTIAGPSALDPNHLPRGVLTLDAERRFGRRFQIGLQIDF